ncbi:MAG: hypothetical protein GY694_07090 [Gammaproteobacteria bacterium]|nr:hypothetical protein [Gammaproteobacteria bacterium]
MKFTSSILIFTCSFLLISCVSTQFGVPQEQWQQMSHEQKQLTIEGYNQRQLLKEQRHLEQRRAEEKRQLKKEQQRQVKIKKSRAKIQKIKNGYGDIGDIVRISILSCEAKIHSKYRAINPVSLKLVDGEQKMVTITSKPHKHKSYSKKLTIKYRDGLVKINTGSSGIFLPYEQSWIKGHRYHNLSSKGATRLKKCKISLSAIPSSSLRHRMNKLR